MICPIARAVHMALIKPLGVNVDKITAAYRDALLVNVD